MGLWINLAHDVFNPKSRIIFHELHGKLHKMVKVEGDLEVERMKF